LGISRKAVDNNLGGKTKKINQKILEEAIALANKTVDLSKQVKEISDYK
jgi:phosphoribosyl-ATP pyrophosphohydrolase